MADELTCTCHTRLASGFELNATLRLPLDTARVTVLFGPSGAGKSTLLRVLAGLERPTSGSILFRGRSWVDVAPQERRAVYVAQDYALFPHLTVLENVNYAARPGKAREHLQAFELDDLADRYPGALSGGQRQRVALARALAAGPALLLLDEPLSALDATARARTRRQLREILLASGVPCIVVTHDRMEAVALGDWIAVMANGRVRQVGPLQDVFQRPVDAEVAESLGVENVLPARIVTRAAGLLTLETGGAYLQCVDGGEKGPVVVCLRAEDVAITRDEAPASSMRNRIAGSVKAVSVEGPLARVDLDCGFPMVALITTQSAQEMELKAGDAVCAMIKTTSVHVAGGTL